MKRVLITGGAGFIGSHLTERLLSKGYSVVVLDNLSTGSLDNLVHLKSNKNLRIEVGDVTNKVLLEELMNDVNEVYHLAASVGVKNIMENLVSSIQNNVDGTIAVLEAASKKNIKVLITSTSEVYGKGDLAPSREDGDLRMGETVRTRWSYACSKALDEYLAFSYYHERNLPVTVVRLFNTVGDRQSDAYGMVIPTFLKQAMAHKPVTIYGDGSQSRCFVYVKDVVWALNNLMEHTDTVGEIYNVGSTETVTINELADKVIEATGSRSEKVFIPYEQAYTKGFDDAQSRLPDISKINSLIGFNPQHSLDDIIRIVKASAEQHVAHV